MTARRPPMPRVARVVLLTMLAVLATPAGPAAAFDPTPNCGTITGVRLELRNDSEWDRRLASGQTYASAVTGAAFDWSRQARGHDGAAAIAWGTGTTVTIGWYPETDFDKPTTTADALCSAQRIRLNKRYASRYGLAPSSADYKNFDSMILHELGHVLGLAHAGTQDSYGGGLPALANCAGKNSNTNLSMDDEAALQYLVTPARVVGAGPSMKPVTANAGFEERTSDGTIAPKQWWGFQSTTDVTSYAGGLDGGSRFLRFTATASSGGIYSTTRVTATSGPATVDPMRLGGSASHRRSTGSDGTVRVVFKYGLVDYPPPIDEDDGCYRNGRSGNPVKVSSLESYSESRTCIPDRSWAICDVYGPDSNLPNADGVAVRIVAYNKLRYVQDVDPARGYAPIDMDRVAAMLAE